MLRGSPAAAYSSNVVVSVEGAAGVIQYAEARTYLQLLDRGEKTMNSPESEYHFELKDAYFVRVRVDAAKLAPILFRMSCQNWGGAWYAGLEGSTRGSRSRSHGTRGGSRIGLVATSR